MTLGTTAVASHCASRTTTLDEAGTPRWSDTYALSFASGLVWLAVAIALIGTRRFFAFDASYDLLLVFPPVATAATVLLVDRVGGAASLVWRIALLATVATTVSVLSTVVLTPLLVIMFRGGVGRNQALTGVILAFALAVVGWPMVTGLIASAREGRWARVVVLGAGVAVGALTLAMALTPGGPLPAALRLDQAEVVTITTAWWLPVYAAAAAYARRLGMA